MSLFSATAALTPDMTLTRLPIETIVRAELINVVTVVTAALDSCQNSSQFQQRCGEEETLLGKNLNGSVITLAILSDITMPKFDACCHLQGLFSSMFRVLYSS